MFAGREFMTRSSNNDKADNGRIFIIVGILCISSLPSMEIHLHISTYATPPSMPRCAKQCASPHHTTPVTTKNH